MNKTVLLSFIVAAVSGCAGGETRSISAPLPGCATANDTLIVPGCRIGPIAVGMTEADLLRAIGSPERSSPLGSHQGVSVTIYEYEGRGLRAWVRGDRVNEVWTSDARYATEKGVKVGSSELELRVALGQPSWSRPFSYAVRGNNSVGYCYPSRLYVFVMAEGPRAGKVDHFRLNSCKP